MGTTVAVATVTEPPEGTGNATPPGGGELTEAEKAIHRQKPKALMAIVPEGPTRSVRPTEWVVDSSASSHICRDRSLFVTYEPYSSFVEGGATEHKIVGVGIVRLFVTDNSGREQLLYLRGTYYVPEFNYNLLSLRKGAKYDDMRLEFDEDVCLLTHKEQGYTVEAPASDRLGLYMLPTLGKEVALVMTQTVSSNAMMLWHRRLGHPGRTAMKTLYEDYFRDGRSFPKSLINSPVCESCIFAKLSRLPFSKKATRNASRPGEVAHSDMGVLPVPSFQGYRYFVVFVDEYTRYIFTRLLKKKSDLYVAFEEFRSETQGNLKWIYYDLPGDDDELEQLRSDNAKEYKKLSEIIKPKYGTRMRFTQMYTPQDNGIAERRM